MQLGGERHDSKACSLLGRQKLALFFFFFMNPCYSPGLQMPAFLDFYSMRSSVEVNRAMSEWKCTQLAVLLGMAVKAVLCVNLNGTDIA